MTQAPRKTTTLALVAALGLSTATLSGCSSDAKMGENVGQTMGAVLGGIAGSMIGGGKGRILATAVGGVLGFYAGKEVGRRLDEGDWTLFEQAQSDALDGPDGNTVSWSNPDSGNSGTITPAEAKADPQTGQECRDFETTVTVDGQLERATGTACRQDDGTWKVVENTPAADTPAENG